MWGIWILLFAVCRQGSSAINPNEQTLMHSSAFKISKLGLSDTVKFTASADSRSKVKSRSEGQVGNYWNFIIPSVNFSHEGTYNVLNSKGYTTSSYALKVRSKLATTKLVPGETLIISLEGLKKEDVSLRFVSGNDSLVLVRRGEVQVNNHSEYAGRIQVTNKDIRLLNFNVSDEGTYKIFDQQKRYISINTVNSGDRHKEVKAGPLLALMLLVIPLGVCCCCRKRICKCCYENKENHGVALKTTTEENPVSPPGAPPAYNNPTAPTPMYPVIGESTVHPPPNPIIPQAPYSGPPGMDPAMNPAIPPSTNPIYPPLYPAPTGFPPYAPGQAQKPQISADTPLLPYPR